MLKDYEYFEINAEDFDFDAHVEFGTDLENEKWVIILAGWYSKTSRILEKMIPNTPEQTAERKAHRHHTKKQWFKAR